MIVLAVTWHAQPGKDKEMVGAFSTLQAASRKEPGCVYYLVHQHKDDTRRFFVYEQYKDEAALQAHRDSSHFKEYAAPGGKLYQFGERQQGDLYRPIEEA